MLNDLKNVRAVLGKYYVEYAENENSEKEYEIIKQVNKELFESIPFPVIFTKNDPYKSAKEMRERVLKEKVIYIYTEFSGHPYLNEKENSIGRAVHDVYAHLVCGCPFTFQGEYNAYLEQRKHYPVTVWKTLFSEIPMQTAAYYYKGSFDFEQKTFKASLNFMNLMKPFKKDYSENAIFEVVNGKIQLKKQGVFEMLNPNTVNYLDEFINKEVIELAKTKTNEIESVSFGIDSGCGYKNNIFVSFGCTELKDHGVNSCMCKDILNQEKLKEINIDLILAEKIAHYVSGLIGGKRVFEA